MKFYEGPRCTDEFVEVFLKYAKRPTDTNRRLVARLICDGHITKAEYGWLRWAMEGTKA